MERGSVFHASSDAEAGPDAVERDGTVQMKYAKQEYFRR